MANSLSEVAHDVGRTLQTRFRVLTAISFSHFLNDMMQSLIVAIYPLLKGTFHLSFTQIGALSCAHRSFSRLSAPTPTNILSPIP
jgi:FSR family fosmidomycin resistance protein-like MFS transporter